MFAVCLKLCQQEDINKENNLNRSDRWNFQRMYDNFKIKLDVVRIISTEKCKIICSKQNLLLRLSPSHFL